MSMYDSIVFSPNVLQRSLIEFEFKEKKVSYDLLKIDFQTKDLVLECDTFKIEKDKNDYIQIYDDADKIYNKCGDIIFYCYDTINIFDVYYTNRNEYLEKVIYVEVEGKIQFHKSYITWLSGRIKFKCWNKETEEYDIIHEEDIRFIPTVVPHIDLIRDPFYVNILGFICSKCSMPL